MLNVKIMLSRAVLGSVAVGTGCRLIQLLQTTVYVIVTELEVPLKGGDGGYSIV